MKLTCTSFGWVLAMDAGRVQKLEVDFRLGVQIGDKGATASLYIETPCYLRCAGQDVFLTPDDASTLAPILAILNAEVADVIIERTGHLTATFKDGRCLKVDPDSRYEAWQIGYTNGFLLVCSPGGEVSVFQPPGLDAE